MSQRLNNLNDIIAVLRAGANFYRNAASQTGKDEREEIYTSHAELRENVAKDLARIVDEAGHEPADASTKEVGHETMTKLNSVFNPKETALADGLKTHEERTLSAFRNAINHRDNERDEPMLRSYMDNFQESYARMREVA